MEKLRTLEKWLLSAEKALLIAFVLIMVSLSFLQVILRGFFSAGFLWADTFLRHMVLWIGFLGAAVAASQNKQFAMDAAHRFFEGRTKAAVAILTHIATGAICWILMRSSWDFLLNEKKSGAILFSFGESFHVPTWYAEVILPVGFGLILIHYAIKTIEAFGILVQKKS